jgi:adenylate cyclase
MDANESSPRRKRLHQSAWWTRRLVALVGAALAVWCGWFALNRSGAEVRRLSYDIPFLVHRAGTPDDVRIAYVDQRDGQSLDRTVQADLLDRLHAGGARAVIYDVMFLGRHADPSVDQAFAAAIRRFRGVGPDNTPIPGAPRRLVMLASGVEKVDSSVGEGDEIVPPTGELRQAADGHGPVTLKDEKLTVRELATGTTDFAGLTWKAASALGADLSHQDRTAPRWVNYAGPPPASGKLADAPAIPSMESSRILAGGAGDFFRDKIVFVGGKPGIIGSQPGTDLFYTPFHTFDARGDLPLMSGVEIHANILANLLHQQWLVSSTERADLWLVVICGVVSGVLFSFVRPLPGLLIAFLAIGGWIATGILTVHFHRFWFPWTVPAFIQIPVALAWGSAANYYAERFILRKVTREWDRLRDVFTRYLSPQMLSKLEERDFQVDLGGEVSRVALMFTDLESFSGMSERVRQPKKILETLNDYFERTTGHIFDHDGVIIQFIGDAIFAAWGTPLPDKDAPVKAVRAAWKVYQSDKLIVDGDLLHTRFGLHYDEVVAGNVGTRRHMDYALVGDGVNLASRLEGLNNMLGTRIVMSGELRAAIGDEFRTRRVGKFKVKGRVEPVEVHELLGPAVQESEPEWLQLYHKALADLEADRHEDALAGFQAVDAMRGKQGDGPSLFHVKQLTGKNPPVGGVVRLTEKQ